MQNKSTLVINPLVYKKNAFYLLIGVLAAAALQCLGSFYLLELPFGAIAIDATVVWLSLAGLIFFISNTLAYYHPKKGKIFLIIGAPLLLAYFHLKLTTALAIFFINNETYEAFIDESNFYRFSMTLLILMSTTIVNLMWYQLGAKEDSIRRQEEAESMAKDAELVKLRQQLQPHFLFNSLNSINSLIGSRPREARNMIQQLSDFLRGTVKRDDEKLVALKDELEYLKLYLDIEQVRFGHRLHVNLNHPEEVLELKIPTLILQPLLENAIKFGLYGTLDSIEIIIDIHLSNDSLHIEIENPFDSDMQAPKGTGFGLKSVLRRLYLLYGRQDLLQTSSENNRHIVFLKIPKSYD